MTNTTDASRNFEDSKIRKYYQVSLSLLANYSTYISLWVWNETLRIIILFAFQIRSISGSGKTILSFLRRRQLDPFAIDVTIRPPT